MSKTANSCECLHLHTEAIETVKAHLPPDETLFELSDLLKLFGDTTRIKILYLLFEKELCVCDIAVLLNMTQSAISHQLKVLKNSKLVKFRREGKVVFYRISDNHVKSIIAQGMEHLTE